MLTTSSTINIALAKQVANFYELIKDLPYKHNGMFNSEIFIVYALYKELSCNMFIESGLDNGVSTERFLKFITDEYVGIDMVSNCYGNKINLSNFTFSCADSITVIPDIVKNKKTKNIFVMIDGPKGPDAVSLKNKLLEYNNVPVVAIHDTYDRLEDEHHLRIFETKNNVEYYKKYFDYLNLKENKNISTIYNLINCDGLPYSGSFPAGPGISIYSKLDIKFTL